MNVIVYRYYPIVLASLVFLACASSLRDDDSQHAGIAVDCPTKVKQGDPLRLDITITNNSNQEVFLTKPAVSDLLIGLNVSISGKSGKMLPKKSHEGILHSQLLQSHGSWNATISLWQYFDYSKFIPGEYHIRIVLAKSAIAWEGRFEVVPGMPLTDALLAYKLPGLRQGDDDSTHKILTRANGDETEIVYWNDTENFDGYVSIDTVKEQVALWGAVHSEMVQGCFRYDLDGTKRGMTTSEEALYRSMRGNALEKPETGEEYRMLIDKLLTIHPIKKLTTINVFWVYNGALFMWSIGKYLPLLQFTDAPSDSPEDIEKLKMKLRQFDVICRTKNIPLGGKATSIIGVQSKDRGIEILYQTPDNQKKTVTVNCSGEVQ